MNAPILSEEAIKNVRTTLYSTPQWQSLQMQLQAAKATFDLKKVALLSVQMKNIEQECYLNYAKSLEGDKCDFLELVGKMKKTERSKFLKKLYALRLLCDVFDTFLLEANATVERFFPDSEVTVFRAMAALKEEVNAQFSTFLDGFNQDVKNIYCELSDKISNYTEKKANEFMKYLDENVTDKEEYH